MSCKYCFVLSCLNNSQKDPEKYYFRVPYNKDLRQKWCIAVDRPALSLKPSSTAYCCSDHFNMVEDLDPFKSTSTSPKLQKDVMPSKYINGRSYGGDKMAEIEDIFGSDVLGEEITKITESEGRYVREVVYIEENDNDQFLQENVEEADGLSNAQIDAPENGTAKAIIEIEDDDNLLNAVATAIKSLKPTENDLNVKKSLKMNTNNNEKKSFVNQIVDSSKHQMKVKEVVALKTQPVDKNETATTKSFKAVDMVISRPMTQVLGKINASTPLHKLIRKVPHPPKEQVSVQQKMIASIPPSKNLNPRIQETCNALVPMKSQTRKLNTVARLPPSIVLSNRYQMTNSATSRPVVITKTSQQHSMVGGVYQVNQAKFTSISRDSKIKDQQNEVPNKRYKQSVDDDDDCILLDEPAPEFNSNAKEVQNKSALVSSAKSNALSGLLIRKLPSCISVKPNAKPQIPNMQLSTSQTNTTISRIVRVEPTTSTRDSDKHQTSTLRITDKLPDQELQLIKLILLENPSIFESSASNTVKIIRSKRNQFQIAENIYYYRTNYQFQKNYFFLNITRNTCQSDETIQRKYGIYWGRPRISCVGIVETRGILDEETKDFVFIQVKKSLFEQNGQQNLKFLNVIQQSVPKPAMIHSITRKSRNNSLQPSNVDPEIINLDDDENEIAPKTKINPSANFLKTVKIPSVDSPLLTQNTTRGSSNEIPANQIVQQPSAKHLDITDAIEIREKDSDEGKKEGLVQFYKRLVPSMQKQINKLRYFEMSNGAVYTVTIAPNHSSPVGDENPCNIVFVKNRPDSNIMPVSRHLSVSMIVNDIFDAINTTNNLGPSKKHDKLMIVSNKMKNPTLLKVVRSTPTENIIPGEPMKMTKLADDIISVGGRIKLAKPADNIIPVDGRTKLVKPAENIIPVGKPIKVAKPPENIIPVGEPIKLATTTGYIKLKSPSTVVTRPIKKTIQPKSTVTIPVDKLFKKTPSPKKGNDVAVSTNNRNEAFKYKCDVCGQGFERSYKFRRHQFVHHNLAKVDSKLSPIYRVSNIVSEPTVEKVKETEVRKRIATPAQLFMSNVQSEPVIKKKIRKHIPIPEHLFTSNVESELIIKEEKLDITVPNETATPDDYCLPDDKTLLIPLYEIPMQEQSHPVSINDFLSVNIKEEPEEHFEEVVVMPLPPVNYPSLKKAVQKKPKQINPKPNLNLEKNTDSSTDSASEAVPFFKKNEKQKGKIKIKTKKLPKKRVTKVCKAVEKIKRRRKTQKRLKKVTKSVIKIRKDRNNPVVPVKISKVKQLMMNLPKCYVNLTDIIKQS